MSSNLRSRSKAKAQLQHSKTSVPNQSECASPLGDSSDEKTKCAICLGDLVNRSYSNNCCHQFCFGCLLEWSKIKPECPLCKSTFTSIYHNIRSNNDYDEYQVPPPIIQNSPMLGMPFLHHFHQLDDGDLYALRGHRYHPHGPAHMSPAIPFGNSFRNRPHAHYRILEYVPYERQQTNPFRGQTEYFGTSIGLHNNDPMASTAAIPNYQQRRRIYDRNQWVIPLGRTLLEGSVAFPSVEYIQTHPTARSRITTWLHRELTVLLGLRMSMTEMGHVYEVIMNVLENYDIRSREFCELVVSYFGFKTRHFQHEFYYFVVSGMSLEEYDRVASYAPTRSALNPDVRDVVTSPPVVTIDDSSDDDVNQSSRWRTDNECIFIPPTESNSNPLNTSYSITSPATTSQLPDLPWDLTIGNSMSELHQIRNQLQQMSSELRSASERLRHRGDDGSLTCTENIFDSDDELQPMTFVSADRHRRNYRELAERLIRDRDRRVWPGMPETMDHQDSSVSRICGRFRPFRIERPRLDRDGESDSSRDINARQNDDVITVDAAEDSRNIHPNGEVTNDDDCVLLGVHPVVKKPPLAVITISDSEDEERPSTSQNEIHNQASNDSSAQGEVSDRCKNEVFENPELPAPDHFMEMCYRGISQTTPFSSNTSIPSVNIGSSPISDMPSLTPSPTSSVTSLPLRSVRSYYFDTHPLSISSGMLSPSSRSTSTQNACSTSRRREELVNSLPTSSISLLRLLDSKKPKNSKHTKSSKNSSGNRRHRNLSSSKKKKRAHSPSTSSDDNRASRSHKSGDKQKKKSSRKKAKRLPSPSPSASSDEDSDSSFSVCSVSSSSSSTNQCVWKKLRHKKSNSGKSNSEIKLKLRKSKKQKKKSSKSSHKKSIRHHHPKRSLPISREYLSSTSDNNESDGETHLQDRVPHASTGSASTSFSSYNNAEQSSSTLTLDTGSEPAPCIYENALIHAEERGGHRVQDYNDIIQAAYQTDGLGDEIRNLVEAAASNVINGHNNPPTLDTLNGISHPEEGRHENEDWNIPTSSPPYLLNLSMSRISDEEDFWS